MISEDNFVVYSDPDYYYQNIQVIWPNPLQIEYDPSMLAEVTSISLILIK